MFGIKRLKARINVLEARQELMQKALLYLTDISNDLIDKIAEVDTKMACKTKKPMGKKK